MASKQEIADKAQTFYDKNGNFATSVEYYSAGYQQALADMGNKWEDGDMRSAYVEGIFTGAQRGLRKPEEFLAQYIANRDTLKNIDGTLK